VKPYSKRGLIGLVPVRDDNIMMREQRSQLWVGSMPSDLWDLIQRDCNNSISS
jgi:hypothetical protein